MRNGRKCHQRWFNHSTSPLARPSRHRAGKANAPRCTRAEPCVSSLGTSRIAGPPLWQLPAYRVGGVKLRSGSPLRPPASRPINAGPRSRRAWQRTAGGAALAPAIGRATQAPRTAGGGRRKTRTASAARERENGSLEAAGPLGPAGARCTDDLSSGWRGRQGAGAVRDLGRPA